MLRLKSFFSALCFILVTLHPASGQELHDTTLAGFYNETLTSYFSDTANKDQLAFGCILVKTEFDTCELEKKAGINTFRFINEKTSEYTLLCTPLKKNIGRRIFWINHKTFGPDTVDVNIGGWTIENVDMLNLSLVSWCSGTTGYIPTRRYFFNDATKTWTSKSSREIILQQAKEPDPPLPPEK